MIGDTNWEWWFLWYVDFTLRGKPMSWTPSE